MNIIVYGSTTGNTEVAAGKIAKALSDSTVKSVTEITAEEIQSAGLVILGTSTWGCGDLQDDWEEKIGILDKVDFTGKKAALFGLGDQQGFPDSFVDGMGLLKEKLLSRGADIIGSWPVKGYDFNESMAARGEEFAGLVLDEENQGNLSDERIAAWVQSLK